MRESPETLESDAARAVSSGATLRSRIDVGAREVRATDWLDLLLILSRHRKTIIATTAAATILAVIVALLLPNMYTATTCIFPPQQSQSAAALLLGQIGVLSGLSSADLGLKNPSDLFTAMLKSRSIEDAIISQFDLRHVYSAKQLQDARKRLSDRSSISDDDEGLITVAVSDRDPKRAADIANAYVDQLRLLNQRLAVSEAAQRRLFYQQKLDSERDELSRAELAMKQAQEKSGLIQPDAQARAIIDAVETTRAQVGIKEVQVQAMRTYATPNNPDLQRSERELAGLRAELANLERSTGELGNGNMEIPTRRLPEVELDYIRLARDLKYHDALYEFLGKQLEAARIDEAKDATVIQVVDRAIPPEKKSSPKRTLIVLITMATVFLLTCLWVLAVELFRRKRQDPDEASRLQMLSDIWKSPTLDA